MEGDRATQGYGIVYITNSWSNYTAQGACGSRRPAPMEAASGAIEPGDRRALCRVGLPGELARRWSDLEADKVSELDGLELPGDSLYADATSDSVRCEHQLAHVATELPGQSDHSDL